jgi:pimeloyl-ACP methyl ester carboxylesterase
MRAEAGRDAEGPQVLRFAAACGVRLHALARGPLHGPPLVLLHGGGANAHWWDHLAPKLAARLRVVALDFRGHGDSEFPESVQVGAFQRDLEALLAHLGRPDAILVGHSMGGHVALDHAAHRGGTRAVVGIELARGAASSERRRTRLALLARRSYRTRADAVRRYRFLPASPGVSEELRRHIAEHSVQLEPDGRFGFKFDARWFGLPARPRPPLERIACPVLIVRGAESGLLTREGAERLVSEIPGASLVEIPGAGHNVHLERPGAVLDALTAFLSGIGSPA